jgi:hypothetical protein
MYLSYDNRLQVRSMMGEAVVAASVSALAPKKVSGLSQAGQQWRRTSQTYEKDD